MFLALKILHSNMCNLIQKPTKNHKISSKQCYCVIALARFTMKNNIKYLIAVSHTLKSCNFNLEPALSNKTEKEI